MFAKAYLLGTGGRATIPLEPQGAYLKHDERISKMSEVNHRRILGPTYPLPDRHFPAHRVLSRDNFRGWLPPVEHHLHSPISLHLRVSRLNSTASRQPLVTFREEKLPLNVTLLSLLLLLPQISS
jgi:hypothetical protein